MLNNPVLFSIHLIPASDHRTAYNSRFPATRHSTRSSVRGA